MEVDPGAADPASVIDDLKALCRTVDSDDPVSYHDIPLVAADNPIRLSSALLVRRIVWMITSLLSNCGFTSLIVGLTVSLPSVKRTMIPPLAEPPLTSRTCQIYYIL